jgi:proteasome accessory factor B
MGKAARVSRLVEMVTLLQSGGGWRAESLAARFGVSRTRIYHDVRALKEAGIPVRSSHAGYRIESSFFLPSVRLTPREVLALLFPRELFGAGQAGEEVQRSAQEKLLSCLPEPLRPGVEELMARTDVRVPASCPNRRVFEQVRRAVAERQRVAIVYSGRKSDRLRRLEVDPYGLAFRKHAWYLVAHSVSHGEVRKFRVSRIGAVEPTPLHFAVPEDFSVEEQFEGAWYVFGGPPCEIRVRFSPRAARLVRDRAPHPGQQIQALSDGSIYYRAVVRNLDEVAWWLAQYGGDAVVSYPAELREKVIDLASSTLAAYGVRVGRRPAPYPAAEDEAGHRVAEPEAGTQPPAES